MPGQPLTYSVCQSLCHFSLSNNNRTKSKAENEEKGGKEREESESACQMVVVVAFACTFMVYSELPTTVVDKLQQLQLLLLLSCSHSETIITIH